MHGTSSDREIATELLESSEDEARVLLQCLAEIYPDQSRAIQDTLRDTSFAADLLVALFQRTKPDRTKLSEHEATIIVQAFNGTCLSR